jgi:hypothetical protein
MNIRTQTATMPMALAEAVECCGALNQSTEPGFDITCENCPLLIERRRDDVLRAARAL